MQTRIAMALWRHVLVCIFLCVFVSAISPGCPRAGHCNHTPPDALERYHRFVEAVTKSRRSAASRFKVKYNRKSNRKRSAYPTYKYAKSVTYYEPSVHINPSRDMRTKSAYTTVQRHLVQDERNALLRQRNLRTMQAQQMRILERIRQSRQKPWWGQWSTWSACGRTCGCGVQFQERHCLGSIYIPTHKNGKLLCEGPTRNYKICNSAPCPTNAPSFRRLQCFQHAANKVRGIYYTWKPYGHPVDEIASNEPCQLVCVSNVNEVQINTVAMDGTECREGWNDGRCVEGKCQLIGCDGKINSTKLRNRCGTCDEDETTCVVYDEVFLHTFDSAGEVKVVQIPEEAYDILITERRQTSANIVLKDVNDTVLLNVGGESSSDPGVEGSPGNVWIAGAEFRYRTPTLHSYSGSFEYILTMGPIKSAIIVYIRAKHRGTTMIHYEFKTAVRKTPEVISEDVAVEIQPDTVSPTSTTEVIRTLESRTEETVIKLAEPPRTIAKIQFLPKYSVVLAPELKENSNARDKPDETVEYAFVDDGDEGYSEEGEVFLVLRKIEEIPVKPVGETQGENNTTFNDSLRNHGGNNVVFVKPSNISGVAAEVGIGDGPPQFPNPVLIEDEETETIARVYTVERQMPTENETDVDYENYGEGEYDDEIPEDGGEDYDIVPGVDIPIPVGTRHRGRFGYRRYLGYHWRTNGFAPCSSTCSSGLQDSYTVCERTRDHITVDDSYCNPTTRPEPVRRSCANQTCEPRWEATPWSECSLSCGTGVQMRTVRCWRMIGPGFDSTLYNEVCNDVAGEKPIETKPCEVMQHCGPLWETSDWSTCSAPCGRRAVKWRTVRCSAGQDHLCPSTPMPHTSEGCLGPKCALAWIMTDWGPCSGVCGGGRKIRRVICADHMGRGHPEDRCDIDIKPATSHPCGDENCRPGWIAQDWEECSAECGEGNRTRTVLCSGIVNGEVHQYEDDTPCNGAPKPPTHEYCQLKECDPVWFTTSWSKCSVTCGNGQRVREVKCYQKSAPATGCDVAEKPQHREACSMPTCPTPPAAQCKNKLSVNCALVVRVRLCSHWYYRRACCSSCQSRRPRGK